MDKSKILIVEDQSIVALDLENRMERLGHTVLGVVASGEEAIQEAARTQPDLVLMDIRLKGSLTGVEAAHAIWNRFDIPAVYLTAVEGARALERSREELRTFGYAGKPFEDEQLEAAIESTLHRHQAARCADQDTAQSVEG